MVDGKMTKAEFEQAYADRSGMTVERLHELGRVAVPCDCEDELCEGWASVSKDRPWTRPWLHQGKGSDG